VYSVCGRTRRVWAEALLVSMWSLGSWEFFPLLVVGSSVIFGWNVWMFCVLVACGFVCVCSFFFFYQSTLSSCLIYMR
jgi:hypothetical protein